MLIFSSIIVLILSISMFFVKCDTKVIILLITYILFNAFKFPIPFGGASFIMSICFFLSELKNLKKFFREIRHSVLPSLFFILILSFTLLYIYSPHYYGSLYQLIRLLLSELICCYFVLFYSFFSTKNENIIKGLLRYSYYSLLILTFVAVLNYISKESYILTDLGVTDNFKFDERFRVQALFVNPFDYGYICLIICALHLYGRRKKMEKKSQSYICFFCCFFSFFSCGCRTILLCAILMFIIYFLFALTIRKWISYLLISLSLFLVTCEFFPIVHEKISFVNSMFSTQSDVGGSSTEMRTVQMLSVMNYIHDSPLLGRGKDFFLLDLGWASDDEAYKDLDLYGLEGVYLQILLERGIIGYMFYLMYWIIIFLFFLKERNLDKELVALAMSIWFSYFLFSHMTGNLSSLPSTLLVLGICLKLVFLKKGSRSMLTQSEIYNDGAKRLVL